jgi:hypothetical protein
VTHLKDFAGVLHADGYAGFNSLYKDGRIIEAACWAHVRRKFFDVHTASGSEIAKQALDRIGAVYGIETTINGASSLQLLRKFGSSRVRSRMSGMIRNSSSSRCAKNGGASITSRHSFRRHPWTS